MKKLIDTFMSLTETEQLDVLFYLTKKRTSDRQKSDAPSRKDKANYLYDCITTEEESKGVNE